MAKAIPKERCLKSGSVRNGLDVFTGAYRKDKHNCYGKLLLTFTTGGGSLKSRLFSVKSCTLKVADIMINFKGFPFYIKIHKLN